MENIWDSKIFNRQFKYIVHWHGYDVNKCSWKPIKKLKCHREGAWISSIISKQIEVHSLWNSLLEEDVMWWMQTLNTIFQYMEIIHNVHP
jgi:hypothetical protein